MHSIAGAFSTERVRVCPTCRGARRVYMGGRSVECHHCGGKGFVKFTE